MKATMNKRVRCRETAALLASLLAYVALLAWTIPRHEPWVDEAQAWQIAGHTSLLGLFGTAIHYEFSPGLWHGLLWVVERLHVGYGGLPWFAAGVALCGVCVAVFASPLPLALRLLLPFSYFFAFQYAVIARSYVLFAPLLFLLAKIWNRREEYPVATAVLIGLLANVSSHALVVALGLVVVVAIEAWLRRRESTVDARRQMIAGLVLVGMIAFAIWCLIPPPDSDLRLSLIAMFHGPATTTVSTMNMGNHSLSRVPLLWRLPLMLLARFTFALSFGVSQPRALAWVAWALLVWRWWRERRLRYAIPAILLGGFCAATRFEVYHAGLVWVLLLFLWWVTWPEDSSDLRQRCLIVAFSLFLVAQVWWTAKAVRYERATAYSPNPAGALVLRRYLDEGRPVDVAVLPPAPHARADYYAVGLEPYFAEEPLRNAASRYWIWRPHPSMYPDYVRDTEARSVVVLLEERSNDTSIPAEEERLERLGYRKDASVCGRIFYPRQEQPELCHVFWVPK
jgi:hypothetical protein